MFVWETIRFIARDFVWSVLYFPVWWYTTGVGNVVRLIVRESRGLAQALNLRILLRFLFQPMFGYRDIVSRIISLYVRIAHFIILFVFSAAYTLGLIVLLFVWLLLPPFVLFNVLFHLGFSPSLYV